MNKNDTLNEYIDSSNNAQLIIYTGKGGVGKTTCAASTALFLADRDMPTLIVSTDPAHSLSDCYAQKIGDEPTLLVSNLWGMELDSAGEMKKRFDGIRQVLKSHMQEQGLNEMLAEEIISFPGSEELFSLLKIAELMKSNRFKAIVVDTAPTGNTLRFLHFPEFLSPVSRALKVDRLYSRIIRPFASIFKQDVPEDNFYSSTFSLFDEIVKARHMILEGKTYFRFVLNPDRLSLLETQRAVSFLNISGFIVDSILLNKIIPQQVTDTFFESWKRSQKKYINDTKESFYPLNILEIPLYENEVIGLTMLRNLSNTLYKEHDPIARLTNKDMFEIKRNGSDMILNIQIPYKERGEIKLHKQGNELIVRVAQYEHTIQLAAVLSNLDVQHAKFVDNSLMITFN